MNLRKSITGAAIALGSATVMLGLGGTAHATDAGADAKPNLDLELGKVGSAGNLAKVDTNNPLGKAEVLNSDPVDTQTHINNVDGDVASELLGYDPTEDPSSLGTSIGI
jgi:hypothetical protein